MRKKILQLSISALFIGILLSGCSLAEKPKVAYTVSNTITTQQVVDDEVKQLKETGAIELWKPSLSAEIQSEKEAEKAAVAGYIKLRMSLDEVEIIVNDQKINLEKEDQKYALEIMKFDFGIANVGAPKALEPFNKIPKDIKEKLLKKYKYKAAYMRVHAAKKSKPSELQTALDQLGQSCETQKGLFVVTFDSKQKDSIAKDVAEGVSFKQISDKYNLDSTAAIQNGFYDCYQSSFFDENIAAQLNDDANINKTLGPFEISGENFYLMVNPISEIKATDLSNLLKYKQINESGLKLDNKLAEVFKESPPTLDEKYGYVEVTDNGFNIKIDKKYLTNTSAPSLDESQNYVDQNEQTGAGQSDNTNSTADTDAQTNNG